jgi:hypothetical protein
MNWTDVTVSILGSSLIMGIATHFVKKWLDSRIDLKLKERESELRKDEQQHALTFPKKHEATTMAYQLLQQYEKAANNCAFNLTSDNNLQLRQIEAGMVYQAQQVFLKHLEQNRIHLSKQCLEKLNEIGLLLDHLTFLAKMYSQGTWAKSFPPNEVVKRLEEINKIQESLPSKMEQLHWDLQKELGMSTSG